MTRALIAALLLFGLGACAALDPVTGTTVEERCKTYRVYVENFCPRPEE